MGQSVEARAKALKYDRKWLRRAERCAAAAAELVERSRQTSLQATLAPFGKLVFCPRDHLGTLGGVSSHWKHNALVSRCTWYACFRVLSQTTAATIAQSIITASIASLPALTRFSWRLRLVTSDRYPAQLAAEVGVQSARKDWFLLHCACEVHKCAGSLSKTLKVMNVGNMWDSQAATVPPPGSLDEGVPQVLDGGAVGDS